MNMRAWIFIAVAAGSLPVVAPAQTDPSVLLVKARALHQAGDYEGVVSLLQAYTKSHGTDSANEYLVPLLVEGLVRKGDLVVSQRLLNIYRQKYPRSVFTPRLWYLSGYLLGRQHHYPGAIESFSRALASGVSTELDTIITGSVALMCRSAMTGTELESAAASTGISERLKEIVRYYEIEKLAGSGQTAKVKQRAEEFRKDYPRSRFGSAVKDLIGKTKRQDRDQVPVGLLAPLSGYDADIGKQIVQGVQTAVERYNESGRPEINLIIADTRGSMIETARKTQELLNDHRVSLLLGPVLSPNAVVAAAMLMGKNAVMISPTATDEGIAELGPNIFQMNVTLGSLGRRIASYAVENLNIRDFAVLAPTTDYGMAMSKRFKEEVERNGGEVVAEEYYEEGGNDYRAQFNNLRAKLLMNKRKAAAALKGEVFTASARSRQVDSSKYADSTLAVGGLFIPGAADDVVMIAAQVYFHRIRTQMLGSTGWRANKTLVEGRQYVNNAILAVNSEPSPDNPKWIEFRDLYRKRFRSDPDHVAALGYDAAQLMIASLQHTSGETDGAQIARYLSNVKGFAGASGRISFGSGVRSNAEATILKISVSEKKFMRVQ